MTDDVQEQWRELEETYSQMVDEEIEELASQAYELTDLAKQALHRQITTRGLKIALASVPPPSDDADGEPQGDLDPAELPLVPCSNVWSAEEAQLVMNTLYNAGIPAYIGPDLVQKVDDFRGNFADKVEIQVRDADFQRAARALANTTAPASSDSSEDSGDYEARCPKCGSDEIVFLELDCSATPTSKDQRFHWHCDACGDDWEDDGVEEH